MLLDLREVSKCYIIYITPITQVYVYYSQKYIDLSVVNF